MKVRSKIVTVGLCPSWDTVCRFDGIDWGEHKLVATASSRPAGKALNISRALAWMGQKNIAAGLWGQDDYEQMRKAMRTLGGTVKVKMTPVEGGTRRNVTVVDTKHNREMHLRHRCGLASKKALRQLEGDLAKIISRNSVCVFAGLMPAPHLSIKTARKTNRTCGTIGAGLSDVVRMVRDCIGRGAKIAVDTYGEPLRRIVGCGPVWLINPNVEELHELLGESACGGADTPASLAKHGRRLLDKVEIVLISRGRKGAVVVTREGAWQGRCVGRARVLSTVGCGDYLLGGFLKGLIDKPNAGAALEVAIKVATAKAWGLTEARMWPQARREIRVEVKRI